MIDTQSRFHSRYSSRCPADDGRHSQNRKRLGRARRPFFEKFPNLVFQPSDREPDALQSVAAWVKATRASNSKSALSPAGQRTSSTSHRGRPTPGTGNGVDGRAEIRHRVAAVGCPRSVASVWRRQHAARRRDFSSLWRRVGAAAAVRSSEGARPPQRPRPARHDADLPQSNRGLSSRRRL